ncbi:hypothetical protein BDV23DRAFT_78115 [Aspergillus alliaceus]|uniref:Uncharacterized protein n=1 Tax=Petromyces alliaceus TaxID=209559 RepID=A0A5N7C970_PETAA|nr:hypothetical protein BDV23DRAFT_78115 [Aspergillus alliaceus]
MRNTLYWWAPDFPGTGLYRVLSVSTSGSLGSGSSCGFSAFFHRSVSPTLQPEVRTFHSNADCQSGCDAPTQFTFLRQIPAESLNSLTVSSHDAGWLSTQSSFYRKVLFIIYRQSSPFPRLFRYHVCCHCYPTDSLLRKCCTQCFEIHTVALYNMLSIGSLSDNAIIDRLSSLSPHHYFKT